MTRVVGLIAGLLLTLMLASPDRVAQPFKVGLPRLTEGQFYTLLDDGYAALRELHKDRLSIVDLRSGSPIWHVESTDSIRVGPALVAGTVVITTYPYVDAGRRLATTRGAITSGYDVRTGRKLWNRGGSF